MDGVLMKRMGLRRLHEDESGTTVMELAVGMVLMAVFMGAFTGAMLMMGNTVNKVEAVGNATAEVDTAFHRLDARIRYATGISVPARSSGSSDYHVEFSTVKSGYDRLNDTTAPTDTTECVQLRVHTNTDQTAVLQQRTWTPDAAGTGYVAGTLSSWVPLASNLVAPTTSPFTVPSTTGNAFRQLTVALTADSGTNTSAPTTVSATFSALNSDVASSTAVCQQVGVDATS